MGGGCYSGPEGTACWGAWWVGLILIGVLLVLAVAGLALLIRIARDPVGFFRYYLNRRNLMTLPLLFVGYMALYLGSSYLVWRYRLPLWAALLIGIPALLVLGGGIWILQRLRRPVRPPGPS